MSSLIVVTRVHATNSSSLPSIESFLRFIENVKTYATEVLILLGGNNSLGELERYSQETKQTIHQSLLTNQITIPIHIYPIFPWGYFTTALNYAVLFAQDRKIDLIAFQSFEFKVTDPTVVHQMSKILKEKNGLVIGPVLEGHDFRAGWNDLRGRTTPWNTFAIWMTNKLGVIGFPLIGDGTAENRKIGGVEEVSAIAFAQNHLTTESLAILTQTPSIIWNTDFSNDPKRAEYHEQKMRSKDERPAQQLQLIRLEQTGRVYHMPLEEFNQFS